MTRCRTTQYAEDVAAGRTVAGRLVRLACERHLRDLADGEARGLHFDRDRADHAIDFIEQWTQLSGGEHEGRPFLLQPWQAFIVGSLFGWVGEGGFRRFRLAYVEIGKGNGKSPLAAAIGLYMLLADGEARAEVYAAATKKDQAMILFRDAVAMVDQSPKLAKRVLKRGSKGKEWEIAHPKSGSWFKPISSDEDSQSGPRPHCGLIDEVHEHKSPHVIDMMRAGTKGRRQALILEITNSGHDRDSACWDHHEYSEGVLFGRLDNDAWFAFVCGLDACVAHREEGKTQPVDGCPDCDDWRDEKVWRKANPNLGISITLTYLREQVKEAEGMPRKRNTVLRLNFCVWTVVVTSWLSPDLWAKGAGKIDWGRAHGLKCYGGVDVAAKLDLTAFVVGYPDFPEAGQFALRAWFWIPEAAAKANEHSHGIPYSAWARQGLITIVPGETMDQGLVEKKVLELQAEGGLQSVRFDPNNANQLCTRLMAEGVRMVEFAQSVGNFNEPSKELEKRLKEGTVRHGDHGVMTWNAGNVCVKTMPSGDIRPLKPDHAMSPKKVDGIIGAIMSLAGAMDDPDAFGVLAGPLVEVW